MHPFGLGTDLYDGARTSLASDWIVASAPKVSVGLMKTARRAELLLVDNLGASLV